MKPVFEDFIQEEIDTLDRYKKHTYQKKYNQYRIRTKQLSFSEEDIKEFNEIVEYVHSRDLNKIVRTPSGGIAVNMKAMRYNCGAYDIRKSSSRISLTVLICGCAWCFVVGRPYEERVIDPHNAWNIFIDKCEEYGIDMDEYKISSEEGKEIAENISTNPDTKPRIAMAYHMTENNKPITNVHHIDFHNSYPSGLVNKYPEFRPVIEDLYRQRLEAKAKGDQKTNDQIKAIMNYVISGCTMSKYHPWNYQWSHIARDVRLDNNERIDDLANRLIESGREILGYNTDGIWYKGEIYHGEGEGPDICQWENDHINCTFRSKSDGAYEFIEDGQYHPVIRGYTTLDQLKPDRSTWVWGDIYKCVVKEYTFNTDKEIIEIYENK